MSSYHCAESSDIDPTSTIGEGSMVWDLAQIRDHAVLGSECIIGRGAYIGSGVRIGDRVKIQNLALVYEPAVLGDGVFVGPAVVLTNDLRPRAINSDGTLKSAADWQPVGVVVNTGASIGARAVCVAPVEIGSWAMIAAGSVVTKDVPDHALMVGSPARQIGWVGRSGETLLSQRDNRWQCPTTGDIYVETDGSLYPENEQD